ncbi:DUF4810 domain-containing protein [Massilibacteroides sp.]|uniref:DUF4810 domain-containing protein n=1 Tax=Massilibacteroides sp. TaxID=2034766 RepID=UPI00262B3E47|nr:DUF4810 domain-containing protein [Massilibacteroides sp.]MDD4514657.1 DUF4810 domain-containing protein [Massilibacteroides sp.]
MKKHFWAGVLLIGLCCVSCSTKQTLYSWSDYERRSYDYVKEDTEKNLDELLASYEVMINKQTGLRKVPPPGISADYGFLLIKKGKKEEGIQMLKQEIALYPESSTFISRIIKKLEE